jgi:hypothetical protein
MKKQGYNSRLDESLGARHGKKSQSFKDRRDESKAMSKKRLRSCIRCGQRYVLQTYSSSSWKKHDHLK